MRFDTDYTMTIDGAGVGARDSFPVINPATEDVIASVPDCSREQLDQAVAAATAAQPGWAALSLDERRTFLNAVADAVEANKEAFMSLLTSEQGKPRAGAEWEVNACIDWARGTCALDLPTEVVEDTPSRKIEVRHTPIGVVGAITPWNYPILLAHWKLAPALLAGNTLVLKPSPYTPLTSLKFGELLRDILPAGVFNVVSGGNDLGKWMTDHPDIGKVTFTGSTATGKTIMGSASDTLKRVTLELGGNDAAIVLPDVDPKRIAEKLFWAAFQNSAQLCVAAKRLYIHSDVYDAVAQALVDYAKTVKMGDGANQGTDLGPIQNKMQFEKVKALLADARAQGQKFLLGGDVPDGKGYFVPVAIVDNPPEDSRVVAEEAFGPVLPLLKFDTIDEAVARANDSDYGLGGSVWSGDSDAAYRVAERLETGTVWINDLQIFAPDIAFGGHKQSGIGVEHSAHGLREFTNAQTIVTNRTVEPA